MDRLHRPPSLRPIVAPSGVSRLLVDLGPEDLRRYRSLVAAAAPRIERRLAAGVLAGRVGPGKHRHARAVWDRTVAGLRVGPDRSALRADVRRCYRSIGPGAVEAGLRRAGVDDAVRDEIAAFLRAIRNAGVQGLPVGPSPSLVLANAVLAIADDAVRREGVGYLRWVDDVVLIGEAARVGRAAAAWRGALQELGLDEHPGKHVEVRGALVGQTASAPSRSGRAVP
jgi:hypothetical protein